MRNILLSLLFIFMMVTPSYSANVTIGDLTNDGAPTTDDLLETENDPSGTPDSRKVTIGNLFNAATDLNSSGEVIGGDADTVTTNANLTGPITSSGNVTAIASQTGTGTTFAMQIGATLVAPILTSVSVTSIRFAGASSDLCAMLLEGSLFYNITDKFFCYCDGTNDLKMSDNSTACF